MNNIKRFKKALILVFVGVVCALCLPKLFAKAEEENDRISIELGVATQGVNVRVGPGEYDYDKLVIDGVEIALAKDEQVYILGKQYYEKSKKDWYHVLFVRNGVEIEGWVTSAKIKKTGNYVTSTPTPSPSPTNTPVPTATLTPTPTNTPTPTPTLPNNGEGGSASGFRKRFWQFVIAALVIMVVIIIIIFVYNKITYSKSRNNEIDRKMKYLKEADLGDKDEGELTSIKRPTVRVVGETEQPAADDETVDSQRELRARIDRLKQHDIVTHKYFGKGEVFDNSDVKLMEVRFGLDVRYLNKDSLVAKHLLTFDDDEKRPTKRKL